MAAVATIDVTSPLALLVDDARLSSYRLNASEVLFDRATQKSLADGGSGCAYECRFQGVRYTLKVISLNSPDVQRPQLERMAVQEITCAFVLNGTEHVSPLIGFCESPAKDEIWLMFDSPSGKSLEQVCKEIRRLDGAAMSGSQASASPSSVECSLFILHLLVSFLKPLEYIHGRGVLHLALKPSNVMVHVDAREVVSVRLSDFHSARLTNDGDNSVPLSGTQ